MKLAKSRVLVFFLMSSIIINILMINSVSAYSSNTGQISGYVWYDFNGNGKWEYNNWNESVISEVKVDLCDKDNNFIKSTTTDKYGMYYFTGLSQWNGYKVRIYPPSGYTLTDQGNGNGNGVKYRLSKADANTGITDIIYPTARDVNIGLIKGKSTSDSNNTPPPVQGSLMDINRIVNKETLTVGETFDVKYTINPKPVLVQQDNTQKDIVLVVDTSGSMASAPNKNSNTSKLETIKTVAEDFVKKFKDNEKVNSNINISLVEFANKAYSRTTGFVNMKNGNVTDLISKIDKLEAGGSTNIGDALRIAYNQLYNSSNDNGHDKYIVFMTDGVAEAYSYNSQGYIMGTESVGDNNIRATSWNYNHTYANPDYRRESLEYAKKVASDKIASSKIKSFFVGFGTEADPNNVQIATAAKGTYQSAIDSTTVTKIYDQIQKQIEGTITGTAVFQETFNSNLEVDTTTLPEGLKVEGNKITGNINIEYTLDSGKTQYESSKHIEFNIKYKAKVKPSCTLGQGGNSSSVTLNVSSKNETKYFAEKVISIVDGTVNNDELMNISRTVDAQNVKVGDVFNARYTINTNPILARQDNTEKDIILVLDTSTSMLYPPNSNSKTSRLEIIQSVASNFVAQFYNKSNVNVGLVDYNSLAKEDKELTKMGSVTAVNSLITAINGLKTDSNTNIGDGLRKAYYMLSSNNGHDKYIVIMTDGVANTYAVDGNWSGTGYNQLSWSWDGSWYRNSNSGWVNELNDSTGRWIQRWYEKSYIYWKYYMGSSDSTKYACFADTDPNGLTYAKKVASELIANSNIKSFIVGFGSEASSNNKDIATAAKGDYQPAEDETAVTDVYSKIQREIDSTIHGTAAFQETFSSNLEVDITTLPAGLKVEGNKVTGTIDVEYTLSDDKTNYVAKPVSFEIKYKVKSKDTNSILGQGGNTSSINLTVSDKSEIKYLPEQVIGLTSTLPEVNINVTDGTGVVDAYVVNSNNTSKRFDRFLPEETKLKGDAYANINFKGEDADIFQYKIVPYSTDPKNVNVDVITNWETLDLQQQKVNNDVVTDKQGYLNQRSYDVSHLPSLTDSVSWSNPNLVFKNPFSATEYKAATYSQNKESYGKWEDYIKADGSKGQRWVTNSIFLPNMTISNDYKEASKFWGYIKVPSDGDYYFGAISDDGCRGYITVNGETKTFVDMFRPQGATAGTTNNVFNLKADTYYPIYLEYFNWGGSAAFELRYSNSPINLSSVASANRIPSEWFYPSKTLTPGEYTNTLFVGTVGIQFPKEPGNYYIAYRTGKKDSNGAIQRVDREGFYGGFTVEKKAELDLKREVQNKKFNVGDEIEIKYTITPKPISISEIYPDGSAPQTYTSTVRDFVYQDIFPKGITPISKNDSNVVINNQKISKKLTDNISYEKEGTEYKARAITFSVYARLDVSESYILKGTDSIITYTDIDDGERQLYFNDLSINGEANSNILKQGIYEKNNVKHQYVRSKQDIKESEQLKVIDKVPAELAMVADIKTSNPKIVLNISGSYTQGAVTFNKYELNSDGTINKSVPMQTISLSSPSIEITSSDTFKLEKNKKYLICYTVTPKGSKNDKITVNAYIDSKSDLNTMVLLIDDLPKVE